MPDSGTIPFKQADPNGHYRSKQLPNDSGDFMSMLGLPAIAGDVIGPGGSTTGQAAVFSDSTGKRLDAATQTGLAKLASGVLSSVAAPIGVVVGTTDVQTLTNKTLITPTITGLTGLTKADVGLPNVDNTSDAAKPVSGPQQAALDLKEDKNKKAAANGYASLDASVKIPLAQIPDSVLGGQQYQGTWNAATNTPAIPTAAIGNKGWYYSVNVAGSTNINGISVWAVGDQIISNGSVWQKIANVSAVNSVNGYTGVVVLGKGDVGLGNVDNTSDASKPVSTATVTQLNLKEDKANKGVANGYAGLDATGKVPAAQVPTAPVTSVATRTGDVVLTKSDVGLSNVDNTSDATKNSATATLTGKTINGANNTLTVRLASDVTGNLPVTNLNAGTGANSGSFWRGDGQWAPPAGGGDVVGPAGAADGDVTVFNGATGKILKTTGVQISSLATTASTANLVTGVASSVDGEVALYNSTTGKVIKRATGTGYVTVVGGVYQTPVSVDLAGRMPRGHLWGLTLANNVTDAINDINIAVGEARDSTNVVDMVLAGAITKRLDAAWAVGTNQGGLDTGSIADVTYHVHLIKRVDTGVVDVLFSASPTAPTLPANYTRFRRIGSIVRSAGTILGFYQVGDQFLLTTQIMPVNTASAFAKALFFFSVPVGIIVLPILELDMYQAPAGSSAVTLYPGIGAINNGVVCEARVNDERSTLMVNHLPTDLSGQLYMSISVIGGVSAKVYTIGWNDLRDRI